MKLTDFKSFRDLSEHYNGPANAWDVIVKHCEKKIDWEQVWRDTENWLLTFDESMSERAKIQQLVEEQLNGKS